MVHYSYNKECYKRSKIIKVQCNQTKDVFFVATRNSNFRCSVKTRASNCKTFMYDPLREILNRGDWECILVEEYPCKSALQLKLRLNEYVEKNECVNY